MEALIAAGILAVGWFMFKHRSPAKPAQVTATPQAVAQSTVIPVAAHSSANIPSTVGSTAGVPDPANYNAPNYFQKSLGAGAIFMPPASPVSTARLVGTFAASPRVVSGAVPTGSAAAPIIARLRANQPLVTARAGGLPQTRL